MSRFRLRSSNHFRRQRLGLESLERRALLAAAASNDESSLTVVYDESTHTHYQIPASHKPDFLSAPRATSGEAGGVDLSPNPAGLVAASPAAPDPGQWIYPPDTRSQITNTTVFPNSAIGRVAIDWSDGSFGSCSGALITPFHVLTAGHCIFSWSKGGIWASALRFSPGQQGNNIDTASSVLGRSDFQPFGQANVTHRRTVTAWTQDADYDADYALLTLDRRVGNFTGAFKFGFNSDDDYYDGKTAYSGGYPGDKNNGGATMNMFSASGVITDVTSDTLESTDLDIMKGQSGSGIYFFNSAQERVVHAILSNYYEDPFTDYNEFTRITGSRFDRISDWIDTDIANNAPIDRPDLVDANAWFRSGVGVVAPQSVQGGQMLLVLTEVFNMGTAPSGSFDIEFRLSNNDTFDNTDILLGTVTVGSLDPFEDTIVEFARYIPTGLSGNRNVVWMIDPDNDVNEFSGQNNVGDGTTLPAAVVDRSISVSPVTLDDYGNNFNSAANIATPSTTYGQIQYQSDVDYFEFTAVEGVTYNFEIEPVKDAITDLLPLVDSTLTLYGTNGTTQLAFNNNAYPAVKWSRIVWTAPANGNYFLKVARTAGTPLGRYNLKATIKDDHGWGSMDPTHVDVPSQTDGMIEQWGDGDGIAFETRIGGVYTIQTSLGTLPDSRLWLFGPSDEGGQFDPDAELAFNDDIGPFLCTPATPSTCASKIVFTAEWADTHYASVAGGTVYETGSYEIHVTVDDDWGNSKSEAITLLQKIGFDDQALPLTEKGNLEDPGDVDWFGFTAMQGVTYTIETILSNRVSLADSTLTLFGTNGTTQLAFNDDPNGAESKITWTAPALGTYYVQVAAPGDETGFYDLKITAEDDHARAFASTHVLESGPFVDGNIVLPEDSDWFKIWARTGENYVLETSEVTLRDGTLAIYDSDARTRLAFNDDAPGIVPIPGSRIDWTAPHDGYYYIVVGSKRDSTAGSYMIRSRVDDVGETPATARDLSFPYFGDGDLEQAGDSDWFALSAAAGRTYLIRTYLGDLADSTLTLFEADPFTGATRQLAFNDNASRTDLASLIEWTAPAGGLYYVRVGSADDRADGSYTLVVGNPNEHGDDSTDAARVGADSSTQGVIGLVGDADWFSFPATAGQVYTLKINLDTLPAATLELFDRDGLTRLDSAEANIEGNSDIQWTAPADGIYFVEIAGEHDLALGSYSLEISTGVENTPPRVTGVSLAAANWTQPFRDQLTFDSPEQFGYAIPSGSEIQIDPLPWTNLDQIRLRLNERVVVQQDSLSLLDVGGTDYSSQIVGFVYDPVSSEATWTLAAPLAANTYVATLSDRVTDSLGMSLDGEWTDTTSSYPSGDGVAGGAFRFKFRVAPGDVDRSGIVERADLRTNLDAQFAAIGSPNYTVLGDLDGDGAINILDWARIRDAFPAISPSSAPSAVVAKVSAPPALQIHAAPRTLRASAVDRAFDDLPVVDATTRLTASRTRSAKSCPGTSSQSVPLLACGHSL
jgi:V8-like Glu-specific endopeptidase